MIVRRILPLSALALATCVFGLEARERPWCGVCAVEAALSDLGVDPAARPDVVVVLGGSEACGGNERGSNEGRLVCTWQEALDLLADTGDLSPGDGRIFVGLRSGAEPTAMSDCSEPAQRALALPQAQAASVPVHLEVANAHPERLFVVGCGLGIVPAEPSRAAIEVEGGGGGTVLIGFDVHSTGDAPAVRIRGRDVIASALRIADTGSDGVAIEDAADVGLRGLVFERIGSGGGSADASSGDDAMDARNVEGLALDEVVVDGVSDSSLRAESVRDLVIRNSEFRHANRYASASLGDGEGEAHLFLRELSGANRIERSSFEQAWTHLDLLNLESELSTVQIRASRFGATWKGDSDAGVRGGVAVSLLVGGASDLAVTVGGADSDADQGNHFEDGATGSLTIGHLDGAAHGSVEARVQGNRFGVSHHSQELGVGNHPQGGVLLIARGEAPARLVAAVSGNVFRAISNAGGRHGNVSLLIEGEPQAPGPLRAEIEVSDNRFERPINSHLDVLVAGGAEAKVGLRGNEVLGGAVDFPPLGSFASSGEPVRVTVRSGAVLELTIDDMRFPAPTFDLGESFRASVAGSGRLCIELSNVVSESGYRFTSDSGRLQVAAGPVASTLRDVLTESASSGEPVNVLGEIEIVTTCPPARGSR